MGVYIKLIVGLCAMALSTILTTMGYIPQIVHLYKVKDSTGIDIVAWLMWSLDSVLFIVYLLCSGGDILIVLLQVYFILMNLWVIVLALMYKRSNYG